MARSLERGKTNSDETSSRHRHRLPRRWARQRRPRPRPDNPFSQLCMVGQCSTPAPATGRHYRPLPGAGGDSTGPAASPFHRVTRPARAFRLRRCPVNLATSARVVFKIVFVPSDRRAGTRQSPSNRNHRNRQEVKQMSSVPPITLNDGNTIPQLGFGVFQIKAGSDCRGSAVRAGCRLPPHRHRRDVRQREAGRSGHPRCRAGPPRGVHHQQAQQRVSPARRRAPRIRRHIERAGF